MNEELDQIKGLIENEFLWNGRTNFAAIIGLNPSKGARSPALWNSIFLEKKIDTQMYPLDVTSKNLPKLLNVLKAMDNHVDCILNYLKGDNHVKGKTERH